MKFEKIVSPTLVYMYVYTYIQAGLKLNVRYLALSAMIVLIFYNPGNTIFLEYESRILRKKAKLSVGELSITCLILLYIQVYSRKR